ncbi:valine--tRNA ligase [Patescibacteria group bacterium]|nr:valine--tRNA ligase [Patescibacteria group bacterium]
MSSEMPKAYQASDYEARIYDAWETSGAFAPKGSGEPYCIVLPPPNRTGTLHMGHATMLAVEDTLVRFQRLCGKRALWIPGTDHAAIATQVKVEQILRKQGIKDPRHDLGREPFLAKVREFAEASRDTIVKQVRAMGSSCDWSREKYTLDEERNRAVFEMFKRMHEDGIIERGYRIVNWDPQFQTTLSDDEVQTKDVVAKLYTFKYAKDFPITISTTRPETKFGDTAVAVHPNDTRYTEFVGKTIQTSFCGVPLSIRVIADEAVDPAFGTGVLGVTPAHSQIDWDMMEKHDLKMHVVIGRDGRLLPLCGEAFVGKTIAEARVMIEERLREEGLLENVEEIPQALPIAERGGAPVEQLPMEQWFVRANKPFTLRQNTLGKWKKGEQATLKQLMIETVDSRQTQIIPERFEKTYFHWVNHLRDWCISRQIWFGHRIPVWYKGEEMRVSRETPGDGWIQDPDTLDTWFSSGMWTFSVFGWPEGASVDAEGNLVKTGDLALYHPTSVLETGYDILFFWVARMILMSTYALGEAPFKDVYLHGLVRDEQGHKMSKSLGNSLDPLDLIPKYGTDAVRLSLLIGTAPGQDVKLAEAKIEGLRNFTNKLWNISRYILSSTEESPEEQAPIARTLADRWLLARFASVVTDVEKMMGGYQLSLAAELLRDFTWNDLADWYLEIAKVEKEGKSAILRYVLKRLLIALHPFMPFVTEAIWEHSGWEGKVIHASWPVVVGTSTEALMAFDTLRTLVTDARRLRADSKIEPAKNLAFSLVCDDALWSLVEENRAWLERLLRAEGIERVTQLDPKASSTASGSALVGFVLETGAEDRTRLEDELAEAKRYLEDVKRRLANADFVARAPERVVNDLRSKQEETETKIVNLTKQLG